MKEKMIDELLNLYNTYHELYKESKDRYHEGFVDGVDLAIQIVEGVFDEEC